MHGEKKSGRISRELPVFAGRRGNVGGSIALAAFPGALRGMNAFVQMFLGSVLCYLPFVALPVMLVNRKAPEMLRLNSLSLGNALRACAVALLTVSCWRRMRRCCGHGVLQRLGLNVFANPDPVPGNRRELLLLLANSAVLAPICEEMLFRGAMLSAWEPRGGKKAVWVTAILFAILHGSIAGFPMHLMAGVLLALLVLYTDSLYAGLIFHTVYNAGITLIAYYQSSLPTDTVQAGAGARGYFRGARRAGHGCYADRNCDIHADSLCIHARECGAMNR